MEHLEHKKEKRNERAAIQLGLFLVGLLLFGTVAGGQLTGKEKNGKEKAAIQTSGVVSDAVEPKKIALTFDDGPHPVYTKILLDGLAERGAKASFFVTGENAEKYPELILRMQKEGHLIGNHTYSHIQLTSNNREAFRQELISTNEVLKEITGAETIFVRPPYGSWDKGFEQELNMFRCCGRSIPWTGAVKAAPMLKSESCPKRGKMRLSCCMMNMLPVLRRHFLLWMSCKAKAMSL